MSENKTYIAIDLKSFYASVECVERGLNPMTTNLVVADLSRTEKTICLAVSPSLKACGIPGRARLFEVIQKVQLINSRRRGELRGRGFAGASYDAPSLKADPTLSLDYIVAPPRMALYMEYSTRIYQVYMRRVSPDDIHVYSIDEVFIDATSYLKQTGMSAHDFTKAIIHDVLASTGIPAAAGIGTNLYLCKVAMDITAKHIPEDGDGVRIAELDEMTYRRTLWDHRPLTDFWRVGHGYMKALESRGLFTMGDIARCSLNDEGLLYKLFGVNAELLIDHAWGWEPCTIADIKAYKPSANSIGSGQVLQCPYDCEKARLVVREMADALVMELVRKGLVTKQLVLVIGYDRESLADPDRMARYSGEVTMDRYGRRIPKHARGTANLERYSSSTRQITAAVIELYDRIIDKNLLVKRLSLTACGVIEEEKADADGAAVQLDIFTDYEALERAQRLERAALEREKKIQQVVIEIKDKYGKNAILKGSNLQEGSTARERNNQIGGHKA
ncbi:MAG: DNA methylase [Clostridia bacterium]|nr:DNA methylase [Clostridia bacterium]